MMYLYRSNSTHNFCEVYDVSLPLFTHYTGTHKMATAWQLL